MQIFDKEVYELKASYITPRGKKVKDHFYIRADSSNEARAEYAQYLQFRYRFTDEQLKKIWVTLKHPQELLYIGDIPLLW